MTKKRLVSLLLAVLMLLSLCNGAFADGDENNATVDSGSSDAVTCDSCGGTGDSGSSATESAPALVTQEIATLTIEEVGGTDTSADTASEVTEKSVAQNTADVREASCEAEKSTDEIATEYIDSTSEINTAESEETNVDVNTAEASDVSSKIPDSLTGDYFQVSDTWAYEYGDLREAEGIANLNISNIEITDLGTGYSVLSFQFADGDNTYEAVLTGIQTDFANSTYAEAGENAADGLYSMKLLAYYFLETQKTADAGNAITDCASFIHEFPNGTTAHNLIDAEKLADANDSELCWAATASNMLWLTGWVKDVTNPQTGEAFKSEDELFQFLISNYTNSGSRDYFGIKWVFDGVNIVQATDGYSIVYPENNSNDNSKSAQIKADTSETSYKDGLISGMPAESVSDIYDSSTSSNVAALLEDSIELLKEGFAIGLAAFNYDDNGNSSNGHAITAMGYVKQLGENIVNAIKGIFIADSDNDKNPVELENLLSDSLCQPIDDASKRRNSYTLYLTTPKTTAKGITGLDLLGYDLMIDSFTTLKPATKKVIENATEAGTDVTRTPSSTIDLVPWSQNYYNPYNEANPKSFSAGSYIHLNTVVQNASYNYAEIPEGCVPAIGYTYKVFKDGNLVDTLNSTLTLTSPLAPLEPIDCWEDYVMEDEGEYMFTFRVNDYKAVNPNDNTVQKTYYEAYESNNTYKGSIKLSIVKEGGGCEDGMPGKPVPTGPVVPLATIKESIPVFTEYYNRNSSSDIKVGFSSANLELKDSIELYLRNSIVSKDNYSLRQLSDGTFEITFTEEYLRTLSSGKNLFDLIDTGSGYTIAEFLIFII